MFRLRSRFKAGGCVIHSRDELALQGLALSAILGSMAHARSRTEGG